MVQCDVVWCGVTDAQDFITGIYLLTLKDTFLTRGEVNQACTHCDETLKHLPS